jgi:replicative DNA helicase
MCYTGDFTPIISGDITENHFQTDQGKAVFLFVSNYRTSSDGAARYPSLVIVRNRFKEVPLPDPDPADSVSALTYEIQLDKIRSETAQLSANLEIVSKQVDPLPDLHKAVSALKRITEEASKTKHASLDTSIQEILVEYDAGNILPDGVPWPWKSMTEATRGLHRKEMVVIAGRPKSRKTFLAIHVAATAMKSYNQRVLFFTPEMPPRQVMLRVIADIAEIRYTEFKNAGLDELEIHRLVQVSKKYGRITNETDEQYSFRMSPPNGKAPSFDIIQSTGKSVSWMQSKIDMYEPDIVVCDSLYRQVPDGGRKNDADWKQVSALSRSVKDLFMETNVMGIATHQMNRGADAQVGSLSNLGLTDSFGQDADLIIRAITGKIGGADTSALVVLGGREVPFDGIMINNKPSFDFSEIHVITNKKQVEALFEKDDSEPEDESDGTSVPKKKQKPKKAVRPSSDMDDDLPDPEEGLRK